MNIIPIEYSKNVEMLLQEEGLPTADFSESDNIKLFGFKLNENLAGIIGIEVQDNIGLLRSLVVNSNLRNTGYGQKLVNQVELWAYSNNITQLYLLTTTAAHFFTKLGYQTISREQAPTFIANTPQFSGLCPASAIFMHKELSHKKG